MDGNSLEAILEAIIKAFVEVFLTRSEDKGRHRQAISDFLIARVEEYSKINRDWADERFLLDTATAFIPMRLVGSTGRSEDFSSVISNHTQMVLQGQPGAGKSTVTRYIALIMARAALDKRRYGHLPQELLKLPPMFPLRVELGACGAGQKVKERIWLSIDEDTPQLVEQKLDEEPILFLLDGLDEVTNTKRRNDVMDEICNLTYTYTKKGHRFVVTTRSSSYSHRTLGGGGYALYRIDELAADQQEAMVRRYYHIWSAQSQVAVEHVKWHEQANDLIDQLRNNAGLARLCSSPLLLAQIGYLHFTGATLPSKRHEVYDRIVRHLVSRRDRPTPSETEHRVSLLDEIAIAMHQQQDQDWMSRERIEEILVQADASDTSSSSTRLSASFAPTTVDQVEKEWGFLVQRASDVGAAERYIFANTSFQEYLTAHAVYRNLHKYWPVLRDRLTDDRWEEVMLLYSAMTPTNQQNPLAAVVGTLRSLDNADSFKVLCKAGRCLASDRTPPLSWHGEIFQMLRNRSYEDDEASVSALEVLCQIEPEGPDLILDRISGRSGSLDQELIKRLLRRIDDSVARQHLRVIFLKALDERPRLVDRIHIAESLAQVGDPRLGALIDVAETQVGRLQTLFRIGKYPVTNFEYSLFLQSTSHPHPPDWQSGGYQTEKSNHPVTDICLADAVAYCDWLTHRIGARCRLPSADEWLTAARAGGSDDLYPWGPHMQGLYLNFRHQFEGTTPVGIYPEGENGIKITDLLGNVWEWTTSQSGNQYVLKGGAWDTMYELQEQGVLLELNASAEIRGQNFGFRLLVE